MNKLSNWLTASQWTRLGGGWKRILSDSLEQYSLRLWRLCDLASSTYLLTYLLTEVVADSEVDNMAMGARGIFFPGPRCTFFLKKVDELFIVNY